MMKFNGVEVPRIDQVTETFDHIGSTKRSASGKLITHTVDVKEGWRVTTTPVSPDEYGAVLAELKSILWGSGQLWFDIFGSEANTVEARIDPSSFRAQTVQVAINGTWEKWARTISFDVEEV